MAALRITLLTVLFGAGPAWSEPSPVAASEHATSNTPPGDDGGLLVFRDVASQALLERTHDPRRLIHTTGVLIELGPADDGKFWDAYIGKYPLSLTGCCLEPDTVLKPQRRGRAIIVESVPSSDLAVGDIVSIKVGPDHAVFTHRIVRLVERPDGLWIDTKGDANRDPDPSITPASAVIGRVAVSIPRLGYLVAALSSPSGTGMVLGLAGLLLALAMLISPNAQSDRGSSLGRSSRGRSHVPDSLKPA